MSSGRPQLTVEQYLEGVISGNRAVLGRAITLVESNRRDHHRLARELLHALPRDEHGSKRVGISGVPGVGKSTFIEGFGLSLVDRGHRVAVLAVDPTSTVSGGSILGDKTRMPELAATEGTFIRPSPTSGSLGGVGRKTRESIVLCEAAGYDVVLVETVGVGQSETLVAEMVDFFLVLMLAGAGDELQGIKRGIVELADLIAINKADGDNETVAERSRAEYERALRILRPPGSQPWSPRVLTCSALYGRGLHEIWQAIAEHHRTMDARGLLQRRRREQLVAWMWALVDEGLRDALLRHPGLAQELPRLENDVLVGRATPTEAAEAILEASGIGRG